MRPARLRPSIPISASAMTNGTTGCFLGYDPGGIAGNGVAALEVVSGRVVTCRTCSRRNAAESWLWFKEAIDKKKDGEVLGIGVDTLTYWGRGDSGRREADFCLRRKYNTVHTSVMSPNRLAGAMLLPGAIVLLRLRANDPALYVTETHPKVLFHALTGKKRIYKEVGLGARNRWLGEIMGMAGHEWDCVDDHQWDALISAWAAYRGYESKRRRADWRNLVEDEKKSQIEFPAGCVEYRWPDETTIDECQRAVDLLDKA